MAKDDAPITLEPETRAALHLFNERLAEQEAEERAARRVKKAEQAKDEAAARVRSLKDGKGTAEEVAAADVAYREAVDRLNRIRSGEEPDSGDEGDTEDEPTISGAGEDPVAEEPPAEEPPAEEPPAEAKATEAEEPPAEEPPEAEA